ncbi:MAG: YhbY family RNA-binding protein [Ethanoligenens sp.]|uniref:YhbY family RNA-binding protein n=1 Tax=Ethanoligenens sp. TaxID=2099655 RepID=UPI0039E73081
MLNSKQRAALRAMANPIDTLFQVGKQGVTEPLQRQADIALLARELIKLRVLETAPVSAKEAANTLAEALGADVVQVIGTRFVLYRPNPEHPVIKV